MTELSAGPPAILYCHCHYAQVVPAEVKTEVLRRLCASGLPFEAVPDLCDLAARRDPALSRLAGDGPVKIAACFPRAVKWLFASAKAPLPEASTEVVNLRVLGAEDAAAALLSPMLNPNLPAGAAKASDAPPGRAAVPSLES